ncbi:MAG: site-specific integrase [Chloroflexota bacterium]
MATEVRWALYPRVAAQAVTRAFILSRAWDSAPKTVDAYARNLEDLLRFFGDAPLERVLGATPDDLQAYVHDLRTRPPATKQTMTVPVRHSGSGTLLAAATIEQRVVTARLFYEYLIYGGHRQERLNPVRRGAQGDGRSRPRRGAVRRQQTRLPWIPSDAQWEQIIRHLAQQAAGRDLCLVLLAYEGALRRQEVVHLRLDDIDWGAGLVTIRPELSKTGLQRAVTLSAVTATLLERYLATERALLLATYGGDRAGPLFLSVSSRNPGVPLQSGAFNDIIEHLRTDVGMPQLRTHTFRHLRCTVLRRCGVDQQDIARYAGHASVASTQLYLHLAPSLLARSIAMATAPYDARMQRLITEAAHDRP